MKNLHNDFFCIDLILAFSLKSIARLGYEYYFQCIKPLNRFLSQIGTWCTTDFKLPRALTRYEEYVIWQTSLMNKTERVKNTYFLLYVVLLAYILIPFHFDAFGEVGYTVPQFFPREVSERMFASFTCSSQGWSHSSLNSLSCRWTFKSNCSTFFFFFFLSNYTPF